MKKVTQSLLIGLSLNSILSTTIMVSHGTTIDPSKLGEGQIIRCQVEDIHEPGKGKISTPAFPRPTGGGYGYTTIIDDDGLMQISPDSDAKHILSGLFYNHVMTSGSTGDIHGTEFGPGKDKIHPILEYPPRGEDFEDYPGPDRLNPNRDTFYPDFYHPNYSYPQTPTTTTRTTETTITFSEETSSTTTETPITVISDPGRMPFGGEALDDRYTRRPAPDSGFSSSDVEATLLTITNPEITSGEDTSKPGEEIGGTIEEIINIPTVRPARPSTTRPTAKPEIEAPGPGETLPYPFDPGRKPGLESVESLFPGILPSFPPLPYDLEKKIDAIIDREDTLRADIILTRDKIMQEIGKLDSAESSIAKSSKVEEIVRMVQELRFKSNTVINRQSGLEDLINSTKEEILAAIKKSGFDVSGTLIGRMTGLENNLMNSQDHIAQEVINQGIITSNNIEDAKDEIILENRKALGSIARILIEKAPDSDDVKELYEQIISEMRDNNADNRLLAIEIERDAEDIIRILINQRREARSARIGMPGEDVTKEINERLRRIKSILDATKERIRAVCSAVDCPNIVNSSRSAQRLVPDFYSRAAGAKNKRNEKYLGIASNIELNLLDKRNKLKVLNSELLYDSTSVSFGPQFGGIILHPDKGITEEKINYALTPGAFFEISHNESNDSGLDLQSSSFSAGADFKYIHTITGEKEDKSYLSGPKFSGFLAAETHYPELSTTPLINIGGSYSALYISDVAKKEQAARDGEVKPAENPFKIDTFTVGGSLGSKYLHLKDNNVEFRTILTGDYLYSMSPVIEETKDKYLYNRKGLITIELGANYEAISNYGYFSFDGYFSPGMMISSSMKTDDKKYSDNAYAFATKAGIGTGFNFESCAIMFDYSFGLFGKEITHNISIEFGINF